MRIDHAEMVTRDESRILLKRGLILRVAGTTRKNLLEHADTIIDTLQESVYCAYMPPGPRYNQSEKEWALDVANTVMPQSMDLMWSSVKTKIDQLEDKCKQAVRAKVKIFQQGEEKLKIFIKEP